MNTAPQDNFSADLTRNLGGWSDDALLKELSRRTTMTTDADHELVSTGAGMHLQHRTTFVSQFGIVTWDQSTSTISVELNGSYGYMAERHLGLYRSENYDNLNPLTFSWTIPEVADVAVDGNYEFCLSIPRFGAWHLADSGYQLRWNVSQWTAGAKPVASTLDSGTTAAYEIPGTNWDTSGWPDSPFEGETNSSMWYPLAFFSLYVSGGVGTLDSYKNKKTFYTRHREAPQGNWIIGNISGLSAKLMTFENKTGLTFALTADYDGSLWLIRDGQTAIAALDTAAALITDTANKREVAKVRLEGNLIMEFVDYSYTASTFGGGVRVARGIIISRNSTHSYNVQIWEDGFYQDDGSAETYTESSAICFISQIESGSVIPADTEVSLTRFGQHWEFTIAVFI